MARLELQQVSVEIPLRGLSRGVRKDGRIIENPAGEVVVAALRDVSIDVRAGDRIGIIGSNGAGKTTLLRVMAGIMPISRGSLTVTGEVYGIFNLTDGVRFSLTGRENARLRYYLLGEPGGLVGAFIEDAREFAELGDFFDLPVSTYSPGMLSRLLFAMGTFKRANIVLMDEWIGVGDRAFQKKVTQRINDFINGNDIFIVASHNREIIHQVTDRIVVLENGCVRGIYRPGEEPCG
jgi:ABC-type polysaccharide/polyol phosphate transport system ATPase subunit